MNCRLCKYYDYETETCINKEVFDFEKNIVDLYSFWEDGTLSDTISDSFTNVSFKRLKQLLAKMDISEKRQKKILDVAKGEVEDKIVDWTESIDNDVANALQNYNFKDENEGGFYCKSK